MKLKSKLYKAATPYDASVSTPALVPRPLCDFQEEIRESSKNATPLALRLNAINWSLREVVARCRYYAVSPYLVHFFRATSQAERGAQVKSNTLTMNFSKARDKANTDWGDGTPATFHEQRSLSERLYKEQGVDTKKLLGHKSQQQTDRYNDDRGKDWSYILS
ncbi:Phage integrase family protein [Kosakonia oryzendophytica]|uniref:Phage integrase family protein n=1 Tax=Kosakonia oryzendophytica TaxID=1005665 RepID=A0A1C4ECE1_9ENTR|nr:Phage integrase family protein [Kosakonia oryzendophytica]